MVLVTKGGLEEMKYKSVTDMVLKLSEWKFRVRWIISRIVKWFRKEIAMSENIVYLLIGTLIGLFLPIHRKRKVKP